MTQRLTPRPQMSPRALESLKAAARAGDLAARKALMEMGVFLGGPEMAVAESTARPQPEQVAAQAAATAAKRKDLMTSPGGFSPTAAVANLARYAGDRVQGLAGLPQAAGVLGDVLTRAPSERQDIGRQMGAAARPGMVQGMKEAWKDPGKFLSERSGEVAETVGDVVGMGAPLIAGGIGGRMLRGLPTSRADDLARLARKYPSTGRYVAPHPGSGTVRQLREELLENKRMVLERSDLLDDAPQMSTESYRIMEELRGLDERRDVIVAQAKLLKRELAERKWWKRLPEVERSRVERAIDMGFNHVGLHGSAANIEEFDPGLLGATTGAGSAREGFYFASDDATASTFAAWARDSDDYVPNVMLADGNTADVGENVTVARLRMRNPLVVDYSEGGTRRTGYSGRRYEEIIQRAKQNGHDGVVIKNTSNVGHPDSDVLIVFDNKNIRSAYAAFDPEESDSADILASVAWPIGVGAAAEAFMRNREEHEKAKKRGGRRAQEVR